MVSCSSTTALREECFPYTLCHRVFKNKRGLNQNLKCCRNKVQESNLNRDLSFNWPISQDNFISVLENNSTGKSTGNSIDQELVKSNDTQAFPSAVLSEELAVCGLLSLSDTCQIITAIYEEVIFWKRNLFLLPSGNVWNLFKRKEFVEECCRLVNELVDDGPLHLNALKAMMIMPSLLPQKPSKNSKSKDHVEKLRKRFDLWKVIP